MDLSRYGPRARGRVDVAPRGRGRPHRGRRRAGDRARLRPHRPARRRADPRSVRRRATSSTSRGWPMPTGTYRTVVDRRFRGRTRSRRAGVRTGSTPWPRSPSTAGRRRDREHAPDATASTLTCWRGPRELGVRSGRRLARPRPAGAAKAIGRPRRSDGRSTTCARWRAAGAGTGARGSRRPGSGDRSNWSGGTAPGWPRSGRS